MRIWCLANDQFAHVQPVEAAFDGAADFIYDKACDAAALLREAPDLVLCVNDYPCDVLRCLDAARSRQIPSLVLQDGILEWRCQYQNPLFGAGGGAPQHQPVMADKIACLGKQSARQIAAWNSPSKVEITGMPRLDFLFTRNFPAVRKPGRTLLVMTAKNPGFTPEQRALTVRSLRDLQKYLTTRPEIEVLWRVSKAVAQELGVENHLQQISSLELGQIIDKADAVITTPSTAMLEAMIAGRPVAALDYHNVPRFVPTAWTISAPEHRAAVVDELLNPPGAKMAFQRDSLRDCLACDGNSARRVADLIRKMVSLAKAASTSGPLTFPANLLGAAETEPSAPPALADLYEGNSVFQEDNVEALQVRLARAENENARLKEQFAELKNSGQISSLLKRGVGRLAGRCFPKITIMQTETESLHSRARSQQVSVRPKLMGITQSSFDPASWFRFVQFIPHLEKAGWEVDHRPNRPDRQWQSSLRQPLARALHYRMGRALMLWNRMRDLWDSRRCDAAFINRDLAGEGPAFQKMFRSLVRRSVYDFDDAIFVGSREGQVRWMCANACWVTPGNEYLAKYARQFTDRVTVIPTVIDTDCYRPRSYDRPKPSGPVRVGWSGSDQSIRVTLVPNLPTLRALQKQVDFELVVITNTKPDLAIPDLRWKFIPWSRDQEPELESKFDIGIMPLVDDAFQKGKCALKLLQYMAAGLPTVASPVGVNADVVHPGVTGMLATTDAEWHQALSRLILDPQARSAMGQAGRDLCVSEYSVRRWLPILVGIFETVRHETGAKKREL